MSVRVLALAAFIAAAPAWGRELWRSGERLGLIARRRELLPGRYTFGLTGRGPSGDRLPRGTYTIRVLAFPGDGTRRQTDSIAYRVR